MHRRLTMIVRALANHGTDGGPVPGQPIPPVAPIPSTHARPRSTTTPAPWPNDTMKSTRNSQRQTWRQQSKMFAVPAGCPGARLRFAGTPTLGSARRPTLGRVPSTHGPEPRRYKNTQPAVPYWVGTCARSYAMRNISHSRRCTCVCQARASTAGCPRARTPACPRRWWRRV